MELADIVDRRKRSRASATYDVKIIRMLHAIEDERLKGKLYDLMGGDRSREGAHRSRCPGSPAGRVTLAETGPSRPDQFSSATLRLPRSRR